MKTRTYSIAFALLISCLVVSPLTARKPNEAAPTSAEEFFIISSVDLAKKQLFLKHPTEVTELVLLGDSTTCLDEHDRTFSCKKLRAGDTVFVTAKRAPGSTPTALRIRLGAMTVDEVHRKYMGPR
jgi:hypothetical protein